MKKFFSSLLFYFNFSTSKADMFEFSSPNTASNQILSPNVFNRSVLISLPTQQADYRYLVFTYNLLFSTSYNYLYYSITPEISLVLLLNIIVSLYYLNSESYLLCRWKGGLLYERT